MPPPPRTADHDVWYAIPSASVERCRAHLPAWRERGYKVAVFQGRERGDIPADITVWSETYHGWPHAVNTLCASIVPASAAIVVTGGDDMLPDPHRGAQTLAREFLERFPDGFGVMQPQGDAYMGSRFYCGSPWLGRGWIDRAYGGRGPMHASYRHNWADNELYWVARCLGVLWERPELTQYHNHFSRTEHAGLAPAYWTASARETDRQDVQLFLARAWQRFPGHEPLGGGPVFDAVRFEREYTHAAESHWVARYAPATRADGPAARVAAALDTCRRAGRQRVAVFGAGSHTLAAGAALARPPVPVVCIIDDQPALRGQTLWGYRIVSAGQAATMALDAVVLSSRTMEDELVVAAGPLAAAGAQVIRLYGPRCHAAPVGMAVALPVA